MKVKINEKATLELDLEDECTIEEFLGAVTMVQKLQGFSENRAEEPERAYTPTKKRKYTKKTTETGRHWWTEKEKKDLLTKGSQYTSKKHGIDIKKCYIMASALKAKNRH